MLLNLKDATIVLLLSFILAQSSSAQTKSVPQNTQLQKAIKWLSGKWHFKNGSQTGTEFWHCGLGCFSIIEDYSAISLTDTLTGMGIIWWDTTENYFKVTWCTNKDPSGCMSSGLESDWKGDSLVLFFPGFREGEKITYKEIFSNFTQSSFTQSLYEIEENGHSEMLFSYTCFRE